MDLRDRFVFDISRPRKREERKSMDRDCECAGCVYLDRHTTLPDSGRHRCKLSYTHYPLVTDRCHFNRDCMSLDASIKVLHDAQKWRRGARTQMVGPYLIGLAIDRALRDLRWLRKRFNNGGDQNG